MIDVSCVIRIRSGMGSRSTVKHYYSLCIDLLSSTVPNSLFAIVDNNYLQLHHVLGSR